MSFTVISYIIIKNNHTEPNGKNKKQWMTRIKCRHSHFVTCQENELKPLKTSDLDIWLHEWREGIYTLKQYVYIVPTLFGVAKSNRPDTIIRSCCDSCSMSPCKIQDQNKVQSTIFEKGTYFMVLKEAN